MFRPYLLAKLSLLVTLLCSAGLANASVITSLYGDIDGFGVGDPIADGTLYSGFFEDNRDAADIANAPQTDIWGAVSAGVGSGWTHTYSLDGEVESATLRLFVAGIADVGSVTLNVDGLAAEVYDFAGEFRTAQVLSLALPSSVIDGETTFSFDTPALDGFIIDFSELTIVTDTVAAVPAPGPLGLLGLSLLGLGVLVRTRRA